MQLWREKRGEVELKDLSATSSSSSAVATEDLNRRWYEANTGQVITDVQRAVRHPIIRWMAATLDGRVQGSEAVFEAKFMLPWSFSEEAAARRIHAAAAAQYVGRCREVSGALGVHWWRQMGRDQDPRRSAPPAPIVTAERKFWRCVESGEPPTLFGVEPPKPRIEAVRIVDMSGSNAWAEFAGIFVRTRTRTPSTNRPRRSSRVYCRRMPGRQSAMGSGGNAQNQELSVSSSSVPGAVTMQRSSPSIGTLAAALAKAQVELVNPEKSLVATIRREDQEGRNRPFAMRHCRAGSTSCGRSSANTKSQPCRRPPSIRAPASSISPLIGARLGEWIASDWPVCAVSETASPHRMGAALTYARLCSVHFRRHCRRG